MFLEQMNGWMDEQMNDVTAYSPQHKFKFSRLCIPMPSGDRLRGEDELSDWGKVCKLVAGLSLLNLKIFVYSKPTCCVSKLM